MSIRDEAPEIVEIFGKLAALRRSLDKYSGDAALAQFQDPENEVSLLISRAIALREECTKKIETYRLSESARDRFIVAVEECLNDPSRLNAKIEIDLDRGHFPVEPPDDWYDMRTFGSGSVLDMSIYFGVLHPELIKLAKRRWSDNPRVGVSRDDFGDGAGADPLDVLEKHGIPGDMSTWSWAYEALYMADKALECLGLDFLLSDYVEWTCTGEPPNMNANEDFGEPQIYLEAEFGRRLDENDGFERLEGCKMWKLSEGRFVSPLWEYLGWRGEHYGELAEYARCLSNIGEGIDAAISMDDTDFDPEDTSRRRLTASNIFRAGEALTSLRIKFELEDVLSKGWKTDLTVKKRAEKGGARSAEARGRRVMSLLRHMEAIVGANPIVREFGPERIAELAVSACVKEDPALWSQGRGRVSDYIRAVRHGELGAELRTQLFSMFPSAAPKRLA